MEVFVVDAFTDRRFSGNQAGVALLGGGPWPEEDWMRALAAELRYSETAYVRTLAPGRWELRYFTPAGEVDLCGHATIAAFTVLREVGGAEEGAQTAVTRAGELAIEVGRDVIWMDMAPPQADRTVSDEEAAGLYAAFGLSPEERPEGFPVQTVSTGLRDILLPVRSEEVLNAARQDETEVMRLSRLFQVVGVHLFCPVLSRDLTARCRNFAPLYGIPEECATGTSNGALTYYLFRLGVVHPGGENRFLQGERMGKPSEILSRLEAEGEEVKVSIGGRAVVVLRGALVEREKDSSLRSE